MTFNCLIKLILEALENRIEILSKQFNIEPNEIRKLNQYDPTSGKYLTWILKQKKNGTLRFPEDGDKVKERLTQFQQLSKKAAFAGNKDINQYQTYSDLAKTIDDNLGVKTKGEIVRAAETEGAKLLKEDGIYKLYLVTTSEAAAKLFRKTDWCVKDPKFFNSETYEPKEFYFVTKNNEPYSLLHINTHQHMDVYDARYSHERLPLLEPIILSDPQITAYYADKVIKGRWKEAEPIILTNAKAACYYARYVIKGRWKEAEPTILKDPESSYLYARSCIGGRWSEAEPTILKNPSISYLYGKDFIRGRWKEAEPFILKDPTVAAEYAGHVMKNRWYEAEPIILKNPNATAIYIQYFEDCKTPEVILSLLKDPEVALEYATRQHKRWPAAEKAALKNPNVFKNTYVIVEYCLNSRRSRWKEAEPFIKAKGNWEEYKMDVLENKHISTV